MVGAYYVFDLDFLDRAMEDWNALFPSIKPYYAVKCNPHPLIIDRLVKLGAGFDCASLAEIQLVQSKGSNDIIYANPCKIPEDLKESCRLGVGVTTFDSTSELYKISQYPMKVLLRIRADDPTARCPLGNKYGADEEDWPELFARTKSLGLELVGISFHVGSGAQNEMAYVEGVKKACRAAKLAIDFGLNPTIIDIGGGFTHGKIPSGLSNCIMDYLDGFKVIAEPGRYFAEKVATLFTQVIGYKKDSLTVDESLYGAFNCRLYDHSTPLPKFQGSSITKTLFGCTCDGFDVIYNHIEVPDLIKVGDYLEWPNMGAYTMSATTSFNGIPFQKRRVLLK